MPIISPLFSLLFSRFPRVRSPALSRTAERVRQSAEFGLWYVRFKQFSGAVPYPRGSEPHPARQVFWLAPSACLPVPAGQWLKSMRSFTELTATGIAPDSHRCSLLIPGRQPPAGNLARCKYRRCFSFERAPRLFFMNILSTKKCGELQVPRVESVGVRHPGRPPEFRPAGGRRKRNGSSSVLFFRPSGGYSWTQIAIFVEIPFQTEC